MIRIEVDFNRRDERGLVPALVDAGAVTPAVGERVDAFDDEGHRCLALVVTADLRELALDPLWPTFASPHESRVIVGSVLGSLAMTPRNLLTVAVQVVAHPTQEPATGGADAGFNRYVPVATT